MANETLTAEKALADSVPAKGTKDTVARETVISYSNTYNDLEVLAIYEKVPSVRKAVDVIVNQLTKCKLKVQNRNGRDITGGSVLNYFTQDLIRDLALYVVLKGEAPVYKQPDKLKVLNPFRLQANPSNANDMDYVDNWFYSQFFEISGERVKTNITKKDLFYWYRHSPSGGVRGSSPLEATKLIASLNYHAARYNAGWFANGCRPSQLATFPRGTPKTVVETTVDNLTAVNGNNSDNANGVVGVTEDVTLQSLDSEGVDGKFLELSRYDDELVGMALGVPASMMGIYSRTRFDTYDAEVESFYEATLLPFIDTINTILAGIVGKWFYRNTDVVVARETPKCRSFSKAAEKTNADIVIYLDPDSSPILAQLLGKKIDTAERLQQVFKMTPEQSAAYVGIELPEAEETKQLKAKVDLLQAKFDEQNEVLPPDLQAKIKAADEQIRECRKWVLAQGGKVKKRDLFERLPLPIQHQNQTYIRLRQIAASEADEESKSRQIRDTFNSLQHKKFLRDIFRG